MSRPPLDGCSGPVVVRGMCRRHYDRWYVANRDTVDRRAGKSMLDLFAESFAVSDTCWPWLGGRNSSGYGAIRGRRAHIVMYEIAVGPVPAGRQLDHVCRVRHCVNPEHLEPVTSRENTMRSPIAPAAVNARKTHCPKGHPYDDQNTIWRTHPRGGLGRHCRACNRSRQWTLLDRVAANR